MQKRASINLSCGVLRNVWLGVRTSQSFLRSMRSTTCAASIALREIRFGLHTNNELTLPRSIWSRRLLNTGRCPAFFAECASEKLNSSDTTILSRPARSLSSRSCDSSDATCLSSASLDLRRYLPHLCCCLFFSIHSLLVIMPYLILSTGDSQP